MSMTSECATATTASYSQEQYGRRHLGEDDRSELGYVHDSRGRAFQCSYSPTDHELTASPLAGQAGPSNAHVRYRDWGGTPAGAHFGHEISCVGSFSRIVGGLVEVATVYYCQRDNALCIDDVT